MSAKSLKNHPIAASLKLLQDLLNDEALQAPQVAADEAAQFNRDKLQNITKSLRSLVKQTPATLVSETALDQMNVNLQSPIGEITSFISNKNTGHLANAVAYVDQNVLNYTWAFLPRVNPATQTDLGEIVDSLLERSRETIEQLDAEKRNLESSISELSENVRAKETSLAALSEAQGQLKAEMAASLSDLETTFNKSQLQRDTDFATTITDLKEKLTLASCEFNAKAESVIEALETHKSHAARIVQVVGDIGVTGNYQTIANKETKQANLWRWITIGLFAGGLVMAAATFLRFYYEPITPDNTLAVAVRLLYALAVAAPAFYTARESARHRTNADRARQTELELASLGPFIELMEDSDKDEIRKSLVPTYFGRSVEPHEIKTVLDVNSRS